MNYLLYTDKYFLLIAYFLWVLDCWTGLTKIFMKKQDLDVLEVSRMQLVSQASETVQRYCLFRANRSKFLKSKKAVLVTP